jgi:hypothetical protein
MKKGIIIIAAVLLIAVSAFAAEWARYSGSKAASASITTGEGLFYGALIATDSTTGITVNIYDSTTASGSKLIPTTVVPTSSAYRKEAIYPPIPIRYYNGIYVSISSTDCAYEVYYRPE